MKFEPCATGTHSSEKPEPVSKPEDAASSPSTKEPSSTSGTTETYGTAASLPPPPPHSALTANAAPPKPTSTAYVEEQDDPEVMLTPGMGCKRKSCGKSYEDGMERSAEECVYHPGAPIFHEGSKGFSCCKRRVLEFDEFRESTSSSTNLTSV